MASTFQSYQDDAYVQKHRWKILIVLNLFIFMATLDGSIVNVALPTISESLHLSIAQSQWIVTAYLMTICALILFFGKLGDMFGKIKIFTLGSIFFIIGSFLCGFIDNLSLLLLARIIQAIGASMTMANSQGIVTDIFPAHERGKALGIVGTFVSLGSIAGPSLGGLIIAGLGWEYIFLVNVPIGIIALMLGLRILPKDLYAKKVKLDITGSSLFALFILAVFSGLLLGQQYSYENILIRLSFILGFLIFIAFLWVEKRKEHPMLQLSLFKNALFSLSISCGFLVFVANFCFNIIAPFYTQGILGLSALHAGFVLMLFPITMVIVAPLSGSLSDKIGSEILTFVGLFLMAITHLGFAFLHHNSPLSIVCMWTALLGVSTGLFQSPNNSLVMSTVARHSLGIAGSVNSLVRNLGMVVGISVATSVLFYVMSVQAGYLVTELIPGRPDIFITAMHTVFLISASICLIGTCLTGWRLFSARKWKGSTKANQY